MRRLRFPTERREALRLFVADVLVASAVLWTFALFSDLNSFGWARLEDMVDYRSFRPFVTRALVPMMLRVLEPVTPDLGALAEIPPFDGALAAFFHSYQPGRSRDPSEAIALFAVMGAFLHLGIWSVRRLLRITAPGVPDAARNTLAWLSACAILVLMPGRDGQNYGYLYDPSTYGLMALSMALLAEDRWRGYVLAFFATALNRESALFLVPVFCVWAWPRVERLRFAELLVAQLAGFAAIRGLLEVMAVGSGTVRALRWPPWDFVPSHGELALLAPIVVVVAAGYLRSSRGSFGASAASLLPVTAVAYLACGSPGEHRAFIEILPMLALSVATLAGREDAAADALPVEEAVA